MALRIVLLSALLASAGAFAPSAVGLSNLRASPSARSAARGITSVRMQADKEDESLMTRRAVVGGLFALLTPLAGLPDSAEAARSGGRAGGGRGGFSSRAATKAAPPTPQVVRPSVTVIQSAPTMPFGGGFGGGYGYGGGFGLSTGQLIGLSAIELADAFGREQRRQAFLKQQLETQQKLGKDEAQIAELQKQLAETNAKMAEIQKAKEGAK